MEVRDLLKKVYQAITAMSGQDFAYRKSLLDGMSLHHIVMRTEETGGSSNGFCLINQHNRDIIPDLIEQSALITYKAISLFVEMKFSFAFWTYENVH
jgi:hypothetical protein